MTSATQNLKDQKVAVRTHRRPLPECEKFCPDRNMECQNHVGNSQKRANGQVMRDYCLDIPGVSKCRWTGSDRKRVGDGEEILYSGMPDGMNVHGNALMLLPNTAKSLLDFRPVNERIITARLQGKHGSMTVVQCYAPTKRFI